MVLEDVYSPKTNSETAATRARAAKLETLLASPIDRLAANIADLVLFLPVLTLVVAPFSRRAKEAQLLGNDEAWAMTIVAAVGAGLLALLLYQTICVFMFGGTPGKLALRLRVVSIWRPIDERPRSLEAFLRSLVWCGELALLGLPWLAIFSNEKRRPFHDRIADTAVIALASKRQAGPPSLAEMSIASGFQSAALTVTALVAAVNIAQYRKHAASLAAAVTAREADGRLCPEVRETIEESPGAKSTSIATRLQTALALFAVDAVDADCLDAEAEFALWKEESAGLAYLARGLATEDETRASSYLKKACEVSKAEGNGTEVCAMASLAREGAGDGTSDGASEGTGETSEDDKSENAAHERETEKLVASIGVESPIYLRVKAFRSLVTAGDYSRALPLMEKVTGGRKVSSFITKERAKALWAVGRGEEAHNAMTTALPLIDAAARVDVARWFCFNETLRDGCSQEGQKSCSLLTESIERFDGWLLKPEVATAFIRGEACGGNGDWKALEDKIPSREGKAYVRALAELKNGQPARAAESFRKVIETSGANHGPFYFEATSQLVELAASAEELKPVQAAWLALDTKDDLWKPLAFTIQRRLSALKAWDQVVTLGLKIVKEDPQNRVAYELMAVAANGSGQKKLALGFLESALRLSQKRSEGAAEAQRAPASERAFNETARQLLRAKEKR